MSQSRTRPDKKREIIERLLDHLPDYEPDGQHGSSFETVGGLGTGEPPRMPEVYWEPPVQELYRSLDRLQIEPTLTLDDGNVTLGRTVHAHLVAFYHSEWRIVRPKPKRRIIRGEVQIIEAKPETWRRERLVSPWVVRPLVERGVVYVVDVFRGEPYLPKQILEAVA